MAAKKIPIYLPALVLLNALTLMYIAGSGFRFPERPWTLYLLIPGSLSVLVAFILLLLSRMQGALFLLVGALFALPYFIPAFVRVWIKIISGEPKYFFTGFMLSFIALLFVLSIFSVLQLIDVKKLNNGRSLSSH